MTTSKVRALYAYKSDDRECLSFTEGDIIEVRSKLKSGWWEGTCNDKEGWFPSNYVQAISDSSPDHSSPKNTLFAAHTPEHRLSLAASDMSGELDHSQWILQKTEDGSAVYYYNTVTHEMRQTLPVESVDGLDRRTSSLDQNYPAFYESEDELTDALGYRSHRHDHTEERSMISIDTQESKGRSLSHRRSGNENSANRYSTSLNQDDRFQATASYTRNSEKRNTLASFSSLRSSESTLLTWEEHFMSISSAIQNLKNSEKEPYSGYIKEDTALVVQRIRLLLCVSNTIDKESSPYLRENKQLRSYHRALLAALAKMVLSAKVASGAWPPSESFSKLANDASEVQTTLKKYLLVAEEMLLEVHEYTPRLSDEPSSPFRWRVSANIPGTKPDPITTLLVLAHNVRGAKASFMESLRNSCPPSAAPANHITIESIAPLLVAQFRNLSNTTSQFLNSVDDISAMNPASSTSLTRSKQSIYEAMGALFVATQSVTDQDLSTENVLETSFPLLISCIDEIERGIKDVCNSCRGVTDPSTHISAESEMINTLGYNATDARSEVSGTSNHLRHQTDKITKFFGEDTLAASRRRDTMLGEPKTPVPGASVTADINSGLNTGASQHGDDQQDFLAPDYDSSEIIFNMEGNVKGGTVYGLVQRLTQHDKFDSKFITTFLLTYRSFCTSEDLFELLFERYTLQPPPGLQLKDLEIWNEKKLKLVRLRVFNVIKSWLETYYNEEEGRSILPHLLEFTDHVIRKSMQFGAEQLIKLIRKRMDAENTSQIRKMTLNVRATDMPVPLLPKNTKRMDLLQINHLELARQLTVMDSNLYSRIKPVECLDKNWGKTDSDNIAANVKASIEYSNQVTAWVTDSILSKDDPKKRAKLVKHWIFIAEQCRILNNFNTCMAILSAFDNSSIGRLRRTWNNVDAMPTQILSRIRRLMGANRNFIEYREIIHKVNPPCIPFLGIYLQDLTFIEDGNSNFLKKTNNLINFAKRMKTADVIRELQQHQSTPYLLQAVPDIQQFITTHLQSSRDEETLYDLSLSCEPKERGEDTMARKLKESGF